jgi:hypothetical protein
MERNDMIQPTVGRVVWYHPSKSDPGFDGTQNPLAAIVAHVWTDSCVNLAIFDRNGCTFNRTSVFLYQGDTDRPSDQYAEWMPYQKGQAAKTEALAAQIGTAA